jgi:hypothetical protein
MSASLIIPHADLHSAGAYRCFAFVKYNTFLWIPSFKYEFTTKSAKFMECGNRTRGLRKKALSEIKINIKE